MLPDKRIYFPTLCMKIRQRKDILESAIFFFFFFTCFEIDEGDILLGNPTKKEKIQFSKINAAETESNVQEREREWKFEASM